MFVRVRLLRILINLMKNTRLCKAVPFPGCLFCKEKCLSCQRMQGACGHRMKGWVKELNKQTGNGEALPCRCAQTRLAVVFFTKNGVLSVLNKAVTYIRDNELTDNLIIVHMYTEAAGNEQLIRGELFFPVARSVTCVVAAQSSMRSFSAFAPTAASWTAFTPRAASRCCWSRLQRCSPSLVSQSAESRESSTRSRCGSFRRS